MGGVQRAAGGTGGASTVAGAGHLLCVAPVYEIASTISAVI
jgi:hypothetical protein